MRRWLEDKILGIWLGKGLFSTLLLPLSWIYGLVSKINLARKAKNSWQAPVPVIVVGNIIAGGTGKTPVCIAICQALQKAGWYPGIISRGYGINIKNTPHLSDTDISSEYLGDEPSLIFQATYAPVAVHPDRSLAAQFLLKARPDINVLISDDGLQHLSLKRDIEVIVQDQRKTGNGRLIPAGPLREPASRLEQADYLINNLTGSANSQSLERGVTDKNIYMTLKPSHIKHLSSNNATPWAEWLKSSQGKTFNAVAGIGQPQRFFNMLKHSGIELKHSLPVADHQAISDYILNRLDDRPILITTKDAVKCSIPYDKRLIAVYPKAVFNNDGWLKDLLYRLESLNKPEK